MIVTDPKERNTADFVYKSQSVTSAVTASVTSPRHGVVPCPHCGHPMFADQVARALPRVQRRIYEAVCAAGSAGISWRDLTDQVYAHDPNGGPGSNSVSVQISQHINRVLERHGLKITSRGGPGSVYRLVKVQP